MTHRRVRWDQLIELRYGRPYRPIERTTLDRRFPLVGSGGVFGSGSRALVEGPVIVIGRKGYAGRVHWINEACWPVDTTYYVVPSADTDPRWLFFQLVHACDHQLLASGTGMRSLDRRAVLGTTVNVPPLAEQRRTVERLERVEHAWQKTARLASAATQMLDALIGSLFPSSTAIDRCQMGDVVEFVSEYSSTTPDIQRRMIFSRDIDARMGRERNSHREPEILHGRTKLFEATDILLPRIRPASGKVVYPQRAGRCSTDTHVLRPRGGGSAWRLWAYLRSPAFRQAVAPLVYGTRIPKVSEQRLRSLHLPDSLVHSDASSDQTLLHAFGVASRAADLHERMSLLRWAAITMHMA